MDNHIIARNPVDRGGDLVLVAGLEGVDDAENLGGVAAGGGRVGEDGADGLLGVNDEDRADGESDALLIDVGSVLVVDHVVRERDLALLVTDDGELERRGRQLVDILDPFAVRVNGVGGETDQLDAALGELRLELGERTELGGADGSEIFRVREEDDPVVADELVEVDGAVGGFGVEVGGDGAEAETAARHCQYAGHARSLSSWGSSLGRKQCRGGALHHHYNRVVSTYGAEDMMAVVC